MIVWIVLAGSTYYPTGADDVAGVRSTLAEAVELANRQPGDWRSIVEVEVGSTVVPPHIVWRNGKHVERSATMQSTTRSF